MNDACCTCTRSIEKSQLRELHKHCICEFWILSLTRSPYISLILTMCQTGTGTGTACSGLANHHNFHNSMHEVWYRSTLEQILILRKLNLIHFKRGSVFLHHLFIQQYQRDIYTPNWVTMRSPPYLPPISKPLCLESCNSTQCFM